MDVLRGKAVVGRRVAVVGAGGIGFDVSEYLLGESVLDVPPEERLDNVHGFLKVQYGPPIKKPLVKKWRLRFFEILQNSLEEIELHLWSRTNFYVKK